MAKDEEVESSSKFILDNPGTFYGPRMLLPAVKIKKKNPPFSKTRETVIVYPLLRPPPFRHYLYYSHVLLSHSANIGTSICPTPILAAVVP